MTPKFSDIHPNAQIGIGTQINNFVTIEDDVQIGENCWIGSGAVIMKGARLGNNVRIFPGAIIAGIPQDLKFQGEESLVEIGNNTTIREYVTVNRGTAAAGTTIIGENCLIQAYCHVAHDCKIGNNCIMSNNTALAGHVVLEDYAIIGGMSAVHQFSRIGCHTMIGGYSKVRTDVPLYQSSQGPAFLCRSQLYRYETQRIYPGPGTSYPGYLQDPVCSWDQFP